MTYNLRRILSTDGLDKNGIKLLRDSGIEIFEKKLTKSELIHQLPEFDAIIIRSATSLDREVIEAVHANESSKLKIIARAGTGVDNIDMDAASKCGLLVINTPAANTISAAEHTFALIMCLSKNIPQAYMKMQESKWDRKSFMGTELYGKTLGIIGLGRIGREIAVRAQVFGMKTIGYDPIVTKLEAEALNVELMNLEELWPLADFITVHVPLIPQTENLINLEVLKKCKQSVKIINCSRGGIVKEDDLLIALNSGICSGAALDVFTQEPPTFGDLIKHPLLISTPHLGASTVEAQYRVSMEIAENLVSISKLGKFNGLVNGHTVTMLELKESESWNLLLSTIHECVNVEERINLYYSDSTELSKLRGFEEFIKSSLAILMLKELKNINLINSLVVAEECGLKITLTKRDSKTNVLHPSLGLEVQNQVLEVSSWNNEVYLCKYNDIELRQAVLLKKRCSLLISKNEKIAYDFLRCKDMNVMSFNVFEDLYIFVTKDVPSSELIKDFDLVLTL